VGFRGSEPLESPPAGGVHKVAGGEQQRCARSLGARAWPHAAQLVDLSFVRTSAPVALFSIYSEGNRVSMFDWVVLGCPMFVARRSEAEAAAANTLRSLVPVVSSQPLPPTASHCADSLEKLCQAVPFLGGLGAELLAKERKVRRWVDPLSC
jgi:hypothetical protein